MRPQDKVRRSTQSARVMQKCKKKPEGPIQRKAGTKKIRIGELM